jgi:hypothetical protein
MEKLSLIGRELKSHSPFTLFGAATGILFMLAGQRWFQQQAQTLFSIFHPLHVVLSAMVTAALFKVHRKASSFLLILIIGIVGSIGIATLSDSILPFFGETILGASIPTHAAVCTHGHAHGNEALGQSHKGDHVHSDACDHPADAHADHVHSDACDHASLDHAAHDHPIRPRLHIGFIEEWYLVFPAAILGVVLAYLWPASHYPHAGHVLVSTWASAAHMLMNTHAEMSIVLLAGMFIALFVAVWLPCCVSDIVFPLLFVRGGEAHLGHHCVLCSRNDKDAEAHG